MRNRQMALMLGAALLLAAFARHPSADIRILMHDATDRAPHRVQAAIDLGLATVSVLVTWTTRRVI